MARCVISAVLDSDLEPPEMVPACIVHCTYAPCFFDGEKADPAPLHSDDARDGGRDGAVRFWETRTRRQRPLVIHHGDLGADGHVVEAAIADCPCGAEVLPAEELA